MPNKNPENQSASTSVVTTIDLLRHGECEDANALGGVCYRGSTDVPLSDRGWQQMNQSLEGRVNNSDVESPWQRIVTSPLMRCNDFAKTLADKHQLPIHVEAELRELHFGDWEGQAVDHVWQTQQAEVSAWGLDPINNPPPGGEAADIFFQRVTECFLKLIGEHSGEKLLLVSHGGVMRVLLAHCLSMPLLSMNRFDIPYGCLSRIQVITDEATHYYRLVNHNFSKGHL